MTTPEILHKRLLEFEHPWTRAEQRATVAERICRQVRQLLEAEYGLKGDFARPPEKADHKGGVIAAVADFFKGRMWPGHKGRKPRTPKSVTAGLLEITDS